MMRYGDIAVRVHPWRGMGSIAMLTNTDLAESRMPCSPQRMGKLEHVASQGAVCKLPARKTRTANPASSQTATCPVVSLRERHTALAGLAAIVL
jgi:hypothetical protein